MKKLILLILMTLPILGFSQLTTTNPDTVCFGTSGSTYQVPNTPGYIYTWAVSAPGIINNGQGTNQIEVDWSQAAPGLIPNGVSVTATNASGCVSPPVNLDVFIYQVLPTINTIGPFCQINSCVNLTGFPLGGVFSGTGVNGNQFCPQNANLGNNSVTYTYTSAGCQFTVTTNVIVNPNPVLTPIEHD